MKYVLLCGGIGKRCNGYSLPKPLNMVNGKYMIEYIIGSIPSKTVYIIYNVFLDTFHFREIIVNLFKSHTFHFAEVEYLTRGAVETAYVGISDFLRRNLMTAPCCSDDDDDNVLFLDNDNLHTFPASFDSMTCPGHFIGYSIDRVKTNYSFLKIQDGTVVDIREKEKISDDYCCGFYGFKDVHEFYRLAKEMIVQNKKSKNEFYFSQLYRCILDDAAAAAAVDASIPASIPILPVYIEHTMHIGSLSEIEQQVSLASKSTSSKLRICFDLDNTLVTFPTVPNDYSTVKPIESNILLLRQLKAQGHEIIIHTARRMKTHSHNVGTVIQDIAPQTIQTLNDLHIEYDELLFGKPFADIYIDDKAMNPYLNDISAFGFFFAEKTEFMHSKMPNNKHNSVIKRVDRVVKSGLEAFLRGEIFFYRNIPAELKSFFPTFHPDTVVAIADDDDHPAQKIQFQLDHVSGIPLFHFYKNKLLTETHINELLVILSTLHACRLPDPICISEENVRNNYFAKLQSRFADATTHYALFDDAREVYREITSALDLNYAATITNCIHGDFWFSNILLQYEDDAYRLIDMKGQVDGILTMSGDIYYDYGKMFQSLLGYDLVLNGGGGENIQDIIDDPYIQYMRDYFIAKCAERGLNIPFLWAVTRSLIFGNIAFVESDATKRRVWAFLQSSKYHA